MPASTRPSATRPSATRPFPSLPDLVLALALIAPATGALAGPLYATTVSDRAGVIAIDGNDAGGGATYALTGANAPFSSLGTPGSWAVEDARRFDDAAAFPATACRFDGGCYAARLTPATPVPEPGVLAMLGFGMALILLRGQRPANLRFRA